MSSQADSGGDSPNGSPGDSATRPAADFAAIAEELAQAGAVTSRMFGHPALKLNGKVFACEFYGAMAFRLGRETTVHAEALLLPGALLFDPSRRDQPFKDWVEVPSPASDQWPMLAQASLDHLVNEST